MLTLTTQLLAMLQNDTIQSAVVPVTEAAKFVNTVTDRMIDYCGFLVPQRLLPFYKSELKSTAVRWAVDGSDRASVQVVPISKNNGFCFVFKRQDKKAGYWAGTYATIDEATADLDLILSQVGNVDVETRIRIVTAALDAAGCANRD